eukprot:TRINITY_DN1079_c0_g1_i1.p1 TRINITY_DN1079_c0_g1~~TRINITY_DN1079_c0_g1_i1.p1  ORF type:complete len:275 (+),score=-17.09 TRINITY_DN1079_c0_g1_i1:753-1577(+)
MFMISEMADLQLSMMHFTCDFYDMYSGHLYLQKYIYMSKKFFYWISQFSKTACNFIENRTYMIFLQFGAQKFDTFTKKIYIQFSWYNTYIFQFALIENQISIFKKDLYCFLAQTVFVLTFSVPKNQLKTDHQINQSNKIQNAYCQMMKCLKILQNFLQVYTYQVLYVHVLYNGDNSPQIYFIFINTAYFRSTHDLKKSINLLQKVILKSMFKEKYKNLHLFFVFIQLQKCHSRKQVPKHIKYVHMPYKICQVQKQKIFGIAGTRYNGEARYNGA